MRLADRRGFGVRLLSHTLPRVLLPGQEYPTEVVVKNGTLAKMITHDGFRIDYRIMQGTEKLAGGTATEKIVLFEIVDRSPEFYAVDRHGSSHPLPEGDYTLYLDFRRNRLSFLSAPFLTQTLSTLIIPFTVSRTHGTSAAHPDEMPARWPAGA